MLADYFRIFCLLICFFVCFIYLLLLLLLVLLCFISLFLLLFLGNFNLWKLGWEKNVEGRGPMPKVESRAFMITLKEITSVNKQRFPENDDKRVFMVSHGIILNVNEICKVRLSHEAKIRCLEGHINQLYKMAEIQISK